MKYSIFGKNVSFDCSNEKIVALLKRELSLYKTSDQSDSDVKISFVEEIDFDRAAFISPAIHTTFENGFLANYGVCNVLYIVDNNELNISIEVLKKNYFLKILSYDYKTNFDVIGTLLHELVLVPMTYFFKDLAIVHSSAFKNNKTGEVFMVGGTGGVGKTTSELIFCKKDEYSFISDDIAVVDVDGYIYPNLSFPKIYAYNVDSDKGFEDLVLSDDTVFEKIHWFLMKKFRGSNKVRRRVSPMKLYGDIENERQEICKYFILLKSDSYSEIKRNKINTEDAVNLTQLVIKNEYHAFHQHIIWHEYNSLANGFEPILNIDDVLSDKADVINTCFKKINSYYIRIPKDMKHSIFTKEIEGCIF